LEQYADYMISVSDNTAADHLIHTLGRRTVERQLKAFGNAHPGRSTPFLTTRELFTLKGYRYPTLAHTYLTEPARLHRSTLRATRTVPLTALSGGQAPRDIRSIEWFGSPNDMCRAFAGLWGQAHTMGLAPVGKALSINDAGLALNPAHYPVTWFKGGSEPGVLTLSYLVQAADGRLIVSSLMLSNPAKNLDEYPAAIRGEAIVRGAIALAD